MDQYIPVIKTTDAEMQGFANLDDKVKRGVLPLIEITRSRGSKNNPGKDILKSIEKFADCVLDGQRFILDMTTEPLLLNLQIEEVLSDISGGMAKWREFVEKLQVNHRGLIPMVHDITEESPAEFVAQVRGLSSSFSELAIRVELGSSGLGAVGLLLSALPPTTKLIVVLDLGYIHLNEVSAKVTECIRVLTTFQTLLSNNPRFKLSMCASTFPKFVQSTGYGRDRGCDNFEIGEVRLHNEVSHRFPNLIYGDFGGIHPKRYVEGFNWVPRVDFPTNDRYYYSRAGREEGGYVTAARQLMENVPQFNAEPLDCWGYRAVIDARNGKPGGRSPAFWISARMNMHITRQFNRVDILG